MEKNNKKINTLIKRKNLVSKLKGAGIKRASSNAILLLERYVEENLDKIINALKEEMVTQGRKTLKTEDINNVLDKINKKEDFFEV